MARTGAIPKIKHTSDVGKRNPRVGPQAMQSLESQRLRQRKGGGAQRALDRDARGQGLPARGRSSRMLLADGPRAQTEAARPGKGKAGPAPELNRLGRNRLKALSVEVPAPRISEPHPGVGAARDLASLASEAPDQRLAFTKRIGARATLLEQTGSEVFVPLARRLSVLRHVVPELLKHRKVIQDVPSAPPTCLRAGLAAHLFLCVEISWPIGLTDAENSCSGRIFPDETSHSPSTIVPSRVAHEKAPGRERAAQGPVHSALADSGGIQECGAPGSPNALKRRLPAGGQEKSKRESRDRVRRVLHEDEGFMPTLLICVCSIFRAPESERDLVTPLTVPWLFHASPRKDGKSASPLA